MFWFVVYTIFVLVICLLLIYSYKKDVEFDKIPGPKGVFPFGNVYNFFGDNVKDFYLFRSLSNKYKQLYKIKLGPMKFVIIINLEDVETVISGSKNTEKGYLYKFLKPWLNNGLLLSSGQKWHHRRRILTPAFHFNILQHYKSIFEENSIKLVEALKSELHNPEVNITKYVSECTLNAICEAAMGVELDSESHEFSRKYIQGIHTFAQLMYHRIRRVWLHTDKIFLMTKDGRKLKEILNLLSSFRDKVISKRREGVPRVISIANQDNENLVYKRRRLAMLDVLFQAEKEGQIDRNGICEEVDTFMFEGFDTTATALQYILMLLANNPKSQDMVVEELGQIFGDSDRSPTNEDLGQMKYLECCIKESLRLHPPVYFILRRLEKETQLRDYVVPANTDCAIIMYDLHRRPDQFVEPQEFRPERFATEPTWHPYAYIPFSAGPRNCIGQRFAMVEMKIVVSSILRHFKLLPVTKPKELIHIVDLILRSDRPIYVKLEQR